MLKRTITSIVLVLVILPICIFSDTVVLPIAVSVLCLLAVYEMLGCIGTRAIPAVSVPAFLLAVAAPLSVRCFSTQYAFTSLYMLVMFLYLVYLFACGVFSHGKLDVERLCTSYAAVLYVITAFSAMIILRDRSFGVYLFCMTLFGPWVSDVFAYLTGRLFGRHKLIPDVSPKKTVEGALGGILFCALAAVLYGYILSQLDESISFVGYLPLAFAGVVISVVSQIGDLIASYIKRRYGVKDYGFILPGHGGIMDRFDSVIGVVPMIVVLSEFPEFFNFFT